MLTLLLGAPAAYGLARYRIRARTVIMFFCLSSLMFPAIMLATPPFVIFGRLHLINSFTGLIIADTTLALPYAIVLLRPVFADIAEGLGPTWCSPSRWPATTPTAS